LQANGQYGEYGGGGLVGIYGNGATGNVSVVGSTLANISVCAHY
jgi:hypothetical protein